MTPDEFSPLQQIRLFLTVERDWLWMARAGRGPRSAPHCSLGHEGDADDSLARLRPHQAARLLPERAVMGRVKAASSSSPSGSMMTDWGRRRRQSGYRLTPFLDRDPFSRDANRGNYDRFTSIPVYSGSIANENAADGKTLERACRTLC